MKDRQKDILLIERALPKLSFELLNQKFYDSIKLLMEAITVYKYGFYIASIFNASLSFEIALLIKVDEKIGNINNNKKRELKKLRNLIERAYKLQIIDEKHKEIAHKIRKLRNCYIHYYNVVYSLIVSSFH